MEIVAELIRRLGDGTTLVGGTVAFALLDSPGRTYVVDLSQPGGRWTLEEAATTMTADATIVASGDALHQLFFEPGAAHGLLQSRTVELIGDRRILSGLGGLFSRFGRSHSVRGGRAPPRKQTRRTK